MIDRWYQNEYNEKLLAEIGQKENEENIKKNFVINFRFKILKLDFLNVFL